MNDGPMMPKEEAGPINPPADKFAEYMKNIEKQIDLSCGCCFGGTGA